MLLKTCSFRVNERLSTSVSLDSGRCLVFFPIRVTESNRPSSELLPARTDSSVFPFAPGKLPKPHRRICSLPGLPEPRRSQQRVSYFPGDVSYSKISQPAAPLTLIPRPSKTFEFPQHLPHSPSWGIGNVRWDWDWN